MTISFSGLGSGLPIDEWITALCSSKQATIDNLTAKQTTLQTKSSTLNSLKSLYSTLETTATKWTDSLLGPTSDLFSKVTVKSSEDSKENKAITATVTNLSTPSEFDITVESLASQTSTVTDKNDAWKNASNKLSELGFSGKGTLSINGTDITVSDDMSVSELVYKIGNSGAGVNAYLKGGQLVLENKEYGAKEMTISGDFADAVGLSKTENQTIGDNAVYTINGEQKTASSNSLDSSDTGIIGLSIELNSVTTDPVTLRISREADESGVKTALDEFVSAFNSVISKTDSATAVGGDLNGESSLNYIRNDLRTLITSNVGSGKYKSLADIGITTGAVGASVDADTSQLVIDEEKFKAAFEADPDAVKELLVGSTEKGTTGLMQELQTSLKPALDSQSGYFKARSDSLSSELSNIASNIENKNSALETYKANLTKKYTNMDLMIAKLNQQFSQLQSTLSSLFPSSDD